MFQRKERKGHQTYKAVVPAEKETIRDQLHLYAYLIYMYAYYNSYGTIFKNK